MLEAGPEGPTAVRFARHAPLVNRAVRKDQLKFGILSGRPLRSIVLFEKKAFGRMWEERRILPLPQHVKNTAFRVDRTRVPVLGAAGVSVGLGDLELRGILEGKSQLFLWLDC